MTASGSDSRSKSGEAGFNSLGSLSLAPILAAQAFGLGTSGVPGGGVTIGGLGGPFQLDQIVPRLFNQQNLSPLTNITNPFESFLGGEATARQIGSQAQNTLTNILPKIDELSQTGFGDDIANLSKFLFENDIAPGLEEQFGAELGLTTGDADLRSALIREGQRTSLEAANQATNNRILGMQLGLDAPSTVAGGFGNVEQLLQQGTRQGTPEGQLLDLLMTFAGLDTQGGGVGFNNAQSTSKGTERHGGFK